MLTNIEKCPNPTTLAELLTGIMPDNLHGEWAAGPPVGKELL